MYFLNKIPTFSLSINRTPAPEIDMYMVGTKLEIGIEHFDFTGNGNGKNVLPVKLGKM